MVLVESDDQYDWTKLAGAEVLRDIIQVPQWRIGMDCERSMMAYRADRRN